MIQNIKLEHVLFLDIETVPETATFSELTETKQELFANKTQYQRKDEFTPEEFYNRAGIWAEFGKIVCISVGYFRFTNNNREFRTTSFSGTETEILQQFSELLNSHFNTPADVLCGHNSKEFDIPFIARRLIINGLPIPNKLNLFGKKPWEIPHLDTMELWKFGDYKHYTSLKLLTNILNVPSPKDDIDGSEVHKVFYIDNDINRITTYCEKDTLAVAQVLLRLKGDELLTKEEITSI